MNLYYLYLSFNQIKTIFIYFIFIPITQFKFPYCNFLITDLLVNRYCHLIYSISFVYNFNINLPNYLCYQLYHCLICPINSILNSLLNMVVNLNIYLTI